MAFEAELKKLVRKALMYDGPDCPPKAAGGFLIRDGAQNSRFLVGPRPRRAIFGAASQSHILASDWSRGAGAPSGTMVWSGSDFGAIGPLVALTWPQGIDGLPCGGNASFACHPCERFCWL